MAKKQGVRRCGRFVRAGCVFLALGFVLFFAASSAGVMSGSKLWVKRYSPSQGSAQASVVAVSPNGQRVFVSGGSERGTATVAYKASTGARLWTSVYPGDGATSIATSPDGSKVFVTGAVVGTDWDYLTVALDARDGSTLWARRYNGTGNGADHATSVVVSPDGSTVFVHGTSYEGAVRNDDYATLAYAASTGTTIWSSRYNAPAGGAEFASAAAVSADGSTVYVTGGSGAGSKVVYATVAYDAHTGAQRWVNRGGGTAGVAARIVVGVAGSDVIVTGTSGRTYGESDYLTVAYDSSTGTRRWLRRYNGPANSADTAYAEAISTDGSTVFVTGDSAAPSTSLDYATVAYDVSTGKRMWLRRYNGPDDVNDTAQAIAVSPKASRVYITGYSQGHYRLDYMTLAYNESTGQTDWAARYSSPSGLNDAFAIAVSPHGQRVFVTGLSYDGNVGYNKYLTVAYGR